jgi:hypothetical protein
MTQQIEPTNLCETCQKQRACFHKGISERETCTEYKGFAIEELLDRDKNVRDEMVDACPNCGSKNTYDCENNPLIEDNTIGHCLDCETYWCLECGYEFETIGKGIECPHWDICAQCSQEHGYSDQYEVVNKICPGCDHYRNECQLEDQSQCEFTCPYGGIISECPQIQELLESSE